MRYKKCVKSLLIGFLIICAASVFAESISDIADRLAGNFTSLVKLLLGGAYLGGFALVIAAIYKFKQHKDNPQQVPMGTPITILLVGVALIFLPSIIQPAGQSLFGEEAALGGIEGSGFESIKSSK